MNNFNTSTPNNQPSIPVTGMGESPVYLPLCEICGSDHPQPVNVLDKGRLVLCADCSRLFGFDLQGVGNDKQ